LIEKNTIQTLSAFWKRLLAVKYLRFYAKPHITDSDAWLGRGAVTTTLVSNTVLLFEEKGYWHNGQRDHLHFSNLFRWSLDLQNTIITLEHLRLGPQQPVFLFDLTPFNRHSLVSTEPHFCNKDVYFAQMHYQNYHLRLNWRVVGPQKKQKFNYTYL
jgi:hypothetical protein